MINTITAFLNEWWIWLIIGLDALFLLILFFSEYSDPNKFLGWALIFIIFPLGGFVLYLFLGQTYYEKHTFRLKGIKDSNYKQLDRFDKEYIKEVAETDQRKASAMRVIWSAVGPSFTANNSVRMFTDGKDKFEAFFQDLRNAKTSINVEYYIVRNDDLGNEFMDIITQKAKEGVEVRFLTDYFGIGKGPHSAIKRFKAAGGKYATFHNLKSVLLSPKKNNRNHRKIAIIDGQISYCGGFNIGKEYLGKGPLGYWRDTAVRMEGGAAIYLAARFAMDWEYASGEILNLEDTKFVSTDSYTKMFGPEEIQVISGGPDVAYYNPIRIQYLEMFRAAKKTIWFHTPYLIPNDSVVDALRIAAGSGVDVRIIIPDKPDHLFVYWNNIFFANRLMKAGVKVYQYNNGFVHSKTVVVDGEYCSVGSANMDDRSLVLNFETNVMVYSKELGSKMMEAFEKDLEHCTQYSVEEYHNRTKMMRIKIAISKLFKNLT